MCVSRRYAPADLGMLKGHPKCPSLGTALTKVLTPKDTVSWHPNPHACSVPNTQRWPRTKRASCFRKICLKQSLSVSLETQQTEGVSWYSNSNTHVQYQALALAPTSWLLPPTQEARMAFSAPSFGLFQELGVVGA